MMRVARLALLCMAAASGPVHAADPPVPPVPVPRDHAFPGEILLRVDATDTVHKLFAVHETIPVAGPGPVTLFYPRWEVGSHAPTGPVWDLAGLLASANGRPLEWRRDPLDPYAFHLSVPDGARALELSFQYLSPPTGVLEMTSELLALTWSRTLLYPAGWFARNIPVRASVVLPPGFQPATALDPEPSAPAAGTPPGTATGTGAATIAYAPVPLDVLADSPLYAGRHRRRVDLAPGAARPVAADLFADADADLVVDPARLARLRAGVRETHRIFGPGHYRRYDMLVSLDDRLSPDGGIEHRASAEVNLPAGFLRHPEASISDETLFTHEYVHSWNGLFRQGEGLWTPDLNAPKRTGSLWVYEGQTELWGVVLAARAGLMSREDALDLLADYAALQQFRVGRRWKSLADTNHDPTYMIGHRIPDRDWQRREDYYGGGLLLWLDVAMKLRRLSGDRHGLEDFAGRFFGGDEVAGIRTFDTAEIVADLQALAPYDWGSLIDRRLDAHDAEGLFDGLTEGGYRLVFTPEPSTVFTQESGGDLDLSYSLGLSVEPSGLLDGVSWNGPAFRAGLAPGATVTAVNGGAFSFTALSAAVANSPGTPVVLRIEADGDRRDLVVPYRGPLRFPRLERVPGIPDRLGAFLSPTAAATGN